jgi:hypothetical protein
MEGKQSNNGYPLPFVKRGILSAYIFGDVIDGFYLDAINNPGFSGGPVVARGAQPGDIDVVGVVSGYRSQQEAVSMRGVPSAELSVQTNTGLLLAFNIRHALQVIEKNPVGFPIKK